MFSLKTFLTKDLMNFIKIALVFMLAYGIGRDVILNPETDRSLSTFAQRLIVPYFHMYGELFIEFPQQNPNETIFQTPNYSVSVQPLVTGIMAVYLLVANVLLLNILIAVFNNTYSEVQRRADIIWKFQRYDLIKQYQKRVFLPPPLSLPLNVYHLLRQIYFCIKSESTQGIPTAQDKADKHEEFKEMMSFEDRCLQKIQESNLTVLRESVEEQVAKISDRTKDISTTLGYSKNHEEISSMKEKIKSLENSLQKIESLMEKLVENRNKNKQNDTHGREYTKTFNEDFPGLQKDNRSREKEPTLIGMSQGAALGQVSKKPAKEENPPNENETDNQVKLVSHEDTGVEYQNILSRSGIYPISDVQRLQVPDYMVSWQVDMSTYDPPKYTALLLAANSMWTDEQISNGNSSSFKFNDVDGDIDRRSYLGVYKIVNGLPRNPVGRTGLTERGILGRYGPNHMCAAIFTRVQCGGKITEALVLPAKNKSGLTFPQLGGDLMVKITGQRRYSLDLDQGGMELPGTYVFTSTDSEMHTKLEMLVKAAMEQYNNKIKENEREKKIKKKNK